MNSIDGTDHFNQVSDELPPSLLSIVLDTNPQAWAHLADTLPLSTAIANLLVFINAHLAFNNSNRVAVIASHVQRAEFLYPTNHSSTLDKQDDLTDGDVEMEDTQQNNHSANGAARHVPTADDANFYRPFAAISSALTRSLTSLLRTPSPPSKSAGAAATTSLAGALTLALTHINKTTVLLAPVLAQNTSAETSTTVPSSNATTQALTSRILVLSASPASPSQYIPLMNTIFAAQRLHIPIDVLALTPLSSPFLQQGSDATQGVYLPLTHPHGLLQTLLQAFLPSPPSRALLIPPTQIDVDFRAACFCHRKVVDVGFVCSVCLSIFCEVPDGAVCLTCGTALKLGNYGGRPAVVKSTKKKRKRIREDGREGTPATETARR